MTFTCLGIFDSASRIYSSSIFSDALLNTPQCDIPSPITHPWTYPLPHRTCFSFSVLRLASTTLFLLIYSQFYTYTLGALPTAGAGSCHRFGRLVLSDRHFWWAAGRPVHLVAKKGKKDANKAAGTQRRYSPLLWFHRPGGKTGLSITGRERPQHRRCPPPLYLRSHGRETISSRLPKPDWPALAPPLSFPKMAVPSRPTILRVPTAMMSLVPRSWGCRADRELEKLEARGRNTRRLCHSTHAPHCGRREKSGV